MDYAVAFGCNYAEKADTNQLTTTTALGKALATYSSKHMTKFELLPDCQAETLAGGWAFPSLTNKTSSMEINNLISQSNVGSAWASTASAGGSGGFGGGFFKMPKPASGADSDAINTQKNILNLTNFGFSFAI